MQGRDGINEGMGGPTTRVELEAKLYAPKNWPQVLFYASGIIAFWSIPGEEPVLTGENVLGAGEAVFG